MLRTVGLDNILISVLCLRQEWYVVYQHVRKVHPFMLRGILGYSCFWAFLLLLCALCTLGVLGLVFYLLWCTRLGSCWCAFYWTRPTGEGRLGHYLHDLWEESMTVHNTAAIFGIGLCYYCGHFLDWEPYMLALVGQPSLHGYYACMVCWNKGALWRNCRLKESKTSFSPVFVFFCIVGTL